MLCKAVLTIANIAVSSDASVLTVTVEGDDSPQGNNHTRKPMRALLWVVPHYAGFGHHVCIRRASGDTFSYHSFYRKVRKEMAQYTGWVDDGTTGGAYILTDSQQYPQTFSAPRLRRAAQFL